MIDEKEIKEIIEFALKHASDVVSLVAFIDTRLEDLLVEENYDLVSMLDEEERYDELERICSAQKRKIYSVVFKQLAEMFEKEG